MPCHVGAEMRQKWRVAIVNYETAVEAFLETDSDLAFQQSKTMELELDHCQETYERHRREHGCND